MTQSMQVIIGLLMLVATISFVIAWRSRQTNSLVFSAGDGSAFAVGIIILCVTEGRPPLSMSGTWAGTLVAVSIAICAASLALLIVELQRRSKQHEAPRK